MENAKQKAIRLAYGEYWEQVKDYVDENGYCDKRDLFHNVKIRYEEIDLAFIHCVDFTMIPKSLQGIETNNGWVRVESEKDLPIDENFDYKVGKIFENGKFYQFSENVSCGAVINSYKLKKITHYMLNKKEPKPIY